MLIHAGASGLGITAIQIAKAHGSKLLTTVRSEAKANAIRAPGADVVINSTAVSVGSVLDDCKARGFPVNVVLDCVGGMELRTHLNKLAKRRTLSFHSQTGRIPDRINLRAILMTRVEAERKDVVSYRKIRKIYSRRAYNHQLQFPAEWLQLRLHNLPPASV